VEGFKACRAPAILVSPSVSTGHDFPGHLCEWIIISKIPFPNHTTEVMKARLARMPCYTDLFTMQEFVQSCLRGCRSMEDRCEVFVVDDTVTGLMGRAKLLKPRWFEIQVVGQIPPLGKRGE